jgi:small nuclear ribonucleoprotein D3
MAGTISGRAAGVPAVLLHDAEGLVVSVESREGIVYRGSLARAEDGMNLTLSQVDVTEADGSQHHVETLLIPGHRVRMIVLPRILQEAPIFDRVSKTAKGIAGARGLGRERIRAMEYSGHRAAAAASAPRAGGYGGGGGVGGGGFAGGGGGSGGGGGYGGGGSRYG